MKTIFASIIACLLFTAAFAQGKNNYSFSNSNNNGRITIETDSNGYRTKVEYTGTVTLNDSETAIQGISDGGTLKFFKNGDRLVAESRDGVVYYQLQAGGENLNPQTEKGAKFIATVVKDLIAFGFDAPRRVARIYKKGGTNAVLAEIGNLRSNYAKQIYFEELLKTGSLTAAEMNTIAKNIALVDGNYEKGQILQKFAGAYLKDPQTAQAYFDATNTITGNYEKSQVLETALRQNLTDAGMAQLLTVAGTITGNYEKGQVLQAALREQLTKKSMGLLLAASASISGDYERAEVLKNAAATQGLGEENCNNLLNAADGIHGNYEKAGVLSAVISNDTLSKNSFTLLLQVAGRIGGNYEKSGVLKALAAQASWSADQWISLINTTASIGGAYEKSDVLVTVARKMPADAKVHAAYMETAKTIGSTYEYEQAVSAAK